MAGFTRVAGKERPDAAYSPGAPCSRIEEAFAAALRGLAVTGILFDIGDQAGIANARAIVRGITAPIKVERGTSEVQPDLFGDLLQGVEALRQQDHVGLVDGSHGDRR